MSILSWGQDIALPVRLPNFKVNTQVRKVRKGFCYDIAKLYVTHNMMTSLHGNPYRIVDPLWEEPTADWWIPLTEDL